MNGTFDPTYSSNQIWMDTNINECLTTHLEGIEGDVSSLQSNKADVNHTHSYNDLTDKPSIPVVPTSLPANGGNADTVDGKHASDFAASSHTHNKSQISGLIEPSDYVVASGPSGEWTYRKWNSGMSECWRQDSGHITHYTTWNGFNVFTGSADWPTGLFIANPSVQYNCYIGSGYAIAARGALSTTTKFNWTALGSDGGSNIPFYIDVYAIGRWK